MDDGAGGRQVGQQRVAQAQSARLMGMGQSRGGGGRYVPKSNEIWGGRLWTME